MSTSEHAVPDNSLPDYVVASTTSVAAYGYVRAKDGMEEELRKLLESGIPLVRGDTGNEQYVIHTTKQEPGVFAFYERWSSGMDLLRHVQQSHIQEYLGRLSELMRTEAEVQWLLALDSDIVAGGVLHR